MKTFHAANARGFVVLTGLLIALIVHAQEFAIDWYTIDGGGGTGTGGVFELSGTIGQPDAAPPMSGGPYQLQGGFWSIFAIQMPGAPFLAVDLTGPGQVTISWDPDEPGFVLQESTSLHPPSWANAPSGSTNPVSVQATNTTTFFRLNKP